jgi:hypothetical protein
MMPDTTATNDDGRGAPAGNRNRTLHGVRGWAMIGSYPKGCSHVRRYVGRMRVELETAVHALCGSVSIYQAALIQSACRHEGRALLLTRWLRTESACSTKAASEPQAKAEALSVTERLSILKEIGNATDSRDKCIRALGLDQQADPLDAYKRALMAPVVPQGAPAADQPQPWTEHHSGLHETSSSTSGAPNG